MILIQLNWLCFFFYCNYALKIVTVSKVHKNIVVNANFREQADSPLLDNYRTVTCVTIVAGKSI